MRKLRSFIIVGALAVGAVFGTAAPAGAIVCIDHSVYCCGTVYVNGKVVDDGFVPPELRDDDAYGPQVVPTGYYFVMSDRRASRSDSRQWGFVPEQYIVGRVAARWWPASRLQLF
jgi:type IV secretory pathway protease TraF